MTPIKCNGCTQCCRNWDSTWLLPSKGDKLEDYQIEIASMPEKPGYVGPRLAHKPNGDCIYVGENGCAIYDKRPSACRSFDCRKWFKSTTDQQKRVFIMRNHGAAAVFAKGKEMLA